MDRDHRERAGIDQGSASGARAAKYAVCCRAEFDDATNGGGRNRVFASRQAKNEILSGQAPVYCIVRIADWRAG